MPRKVCYYSIMGNEILKVDHDHDLYCRWSSVVDGPTFVGTREEISEWLFKEYATIAEAEDPERAVWVRNRIERILADADKYGSSGNRPMGHLWGDNLMYKQMGMLPREKLYDFLIFFLESRGTEEEEFDVSLLQPFKDGR